MIDRFGRGLFVSSAIVAMVAATPAMAQSKSFDVPAQAAQTGVAAFGKQADIQIVAARKFTKGKQTNSVRGSMTVEQGLAQLLAGTGLTFRATGGQTYMIVPLASAGAASGVQAGQGQALLVGSVRDHKTGAALKGARVEVVETGDSTSTGDLGDFRFARLPAGDVTLRISYLGFPEQTETVSVVGGFANRTDIYLGQGATSEIVVYGQVSARAQALNQERTAENSTTVISGDLLGNFNGTTISDSLRRAPGVAFQYNPETGDGTNIIVRGLSPDYNQIKLNGVALPDDTGIGRSPNLSNLLSDSVSEIKISKTLLANQDSYGTGGLVEIETKSPLDRPRRYFNLSADGTKYGKGYGDEYSLSGTASFRFGAENNFGISASVQRRRQDQFSSSYGLSGVFGAYLPLLPNGIPASPETLDPRTPFPFYEGAEFLVRDVSVLSNHIVSKTDNLNVSAEWQVSQGTNLRLDYVHSIRSSSRFNNKYLLRADSAGYTLAPVPGLNGEQRYIFADLAGTLSASSDTSLALDKNTTDTISFRGKSAFGPLTVQYNAGYAKGSSVQPLSSALQLASASLAVNADNFLPDIFDPIVGRVGSLFGPRRGHAIPAPRLTPAGFERLRNDLLSRFRSYGATVGSGGSSDVWNGGLNIRYDAGSGILKYVEAGIEYKRSSFGRRIPSSFGYRAIDPNNPLPLDQIGVEFENLPFSTGAGDQLYRLVTQRSYERLADRLSDYADDGLIIRDEAEPDPIFDGQGTKEEALAGYVQARVDIGKLEIIGGVRFDRNLVDASYFNSDSIYDEFFTLDQDFFESRFRIFNDKDAVVTVLPRVLVNFRPRENIVLRGGYYSTVARPRIEQLNSSKSLSYYAAPFFGPGSSQPLLLISSGNPALKPAWTHNFDVSAEWYDGNVGVIKLSAFYKRINNLIESNVAYGLDALGDYQLPDHPVLNNLPSDVSVQLIYPINNPRPATVWGMEAAVERRLSFLPGILSGLGIYANYIYTDSKKTQTFSFYEPQFDGAGNIAGYRNIYYDLRLSFDQSPRHSGTAGLTYSRAGFDASLYYTMQARRLASGGQPYGMDSYIEPYASLDLRAVYQFKLAGRDFRVSFDGKNLLKDQSDPNYEETIGGVDGKSKYYTGGHFVGGRSFSLGLSATF